MFGDVGATIIYLTLILISLLVLTNFRLSQWVQVFFPKRDEAAAETGTDEASLARRARELEKQSKKLQEQVEKAAGPSGLGADMQPVPEPTVRNLSVPQSKPADAAGRAKKSAAPDPSPPPPRPKPRRSRPPNPRPPPPPTFSAGKMR